ncbi:MAG: hypothetical protein LBC77_03240 [Spirochaetaceae bacterium]|jgi:hypothetical protein|nr:hypothetical protein [Spirochaetaceae bacterium]
MTKKFVLLAFVLIGLGMSGCATYSTVSGVPTPLGAYSSASINKSASVIAEYSIIVGLVTIGYEDFLKKVGSQQVDIIDTNYFNFYRIVKAVKQR